MLEDKSRHSISGTSVVTTQQPECSATLGKLIGPQVIRTCKVSDQIPGRSSAMAQPPMPRRRKSTNRVGSGAGGYPDGIPRALVLWY